MPIHRAYCWNEPQHSPQPRYLRRPDFVDCRNSATSEADATAANMDKPTFDDESILVVALNSPGSQNLVDPTNLATLFTTGPFVSSLQTWSTDYFTQLVSNGKDVNYIFFDYEQDFESYSLFSGMSGAQRQTKMDELFLSAPALAEVPSYISSLTSAKFNTELDTIQSPIGQTTRTIFDDFAMLYLGIAIQVGFIEPAEAALGHPVQWSNYGSSANYAWRVKGSNGTRREPSGGALGEICSPILYWNSGLSGSLNGMAKHEFWGHLQRVIDVYFSIRATGMEVIPWIGAFNWDSFSGETHKGLLYGHTKLVQALSAAGMTRFLYFNSKTLGTPSEDEKLAMDAQCAAACESCEDIPVSAQEYTPITQTPEFLDRDSFNVCGVEFVYDEFIASFRDG